MVIETSTSINDQRDLCSFHLRSKEPCLRIQENGPGGGYTVLTATMIIVLPSFLLINETRLILLMFHEL